MQRKLAVPRDARLATAFAAPLVAALTAFLTLALGQHVLGAEAADAALDLKDHVRAPAAVSFVNDVLPVLSKAGCNQGTCHGGATGKGGFRLSLRGYAPELDWPVIVRDDFGRRINVAEPQQSLLLRKPTLATPHQGGRLIELGSPAFEILVRWIAAGAPGPRDDEPRAEALSITALDSSAEADAGLIRPGTARQLQAVARFSDGSSRDVTAWTRWDTSDAMVARVDAVGRVTAVAGGRAAASGAYQSLVSAQPIAVAFAATGESSTSFDYDTLARANYIDDLIIADWRLLGLQPSPPVDDATFYRRLALDVTGTLPTPDEVRAYAADTRPDKRARAVDALVARDEFVDMWAQKWEDIFRASREWIGEKSVWVFDHYLRDAVARNRPWNEVARELIAGTGNSSSSGPPNFFRLQKVFNELELWPLTAAETTAQTFLGIRLQCARCHNHPFDRWTQADYYAMVSYFARTSPKTDADGNTVIYERASGEIAHPRLGRPMAPQPLGGPRSPAVEGTNRREALAAWVASPDNPYFARATANRVWRHFMGRGLVEPVDDLRPSNPPSNPALLAALADDLAAHSFDVRHLMRVILLSETYRLSSLATAENVVDRQFYSHWLPRRLTAEQLLDALAAVTGVPEKFAGLPAGYRAQRLPDTKFASAFLDMFGRPLRRSACECERIQEPNLAQSLELMNSEAIDARVRSDQGLVAGLIGRGASDDELAGEIYWRALGRAPTDAERQLCQTELTTAFAGAGASDPAAVRRQCFEDLLWAVLNSKEFVFNH
ncbi:MAG: DUF1549 and DUF1553 domain-containing protein [Pirellulales bacterium]|nr:DUF1549 and DUF1553 domain-containing protein [Pirellulales bacterium]